MIRYILKISFLIVVCVFAIRILGVVSVLILSGIFASIYFAMEKFRRRFPQPHVPALSPHGDERVWEPVDPNPLPIKPRNREYASSLMDGEALVIVYEDGEGNITRRTIRLRRMQYEQEEREIFPIMIDAFCELRKAERSFLCGRIMKASTVTGLTIREEDLSTYLTIHTNIPRQEEWDEKSVIELNKPRIMVLVGYTDPTRKPTAYTLHLTAMNVIIEKTLAQETMIIKKITGYCERIKRDRTINYDRIISICDPDTGEVIEDQTAFLNAHRAS